ncbi:MAG: protein kinase, partial [Pirellulaceae bacterium]
MTWNAEQPVTPVPQNSTAELPAPASAEAVPVLTSTTPLDTRSTDPDDTGTDSPRSTSAPETAGGNDLDTDRSVGDRDDAIAEQLVAWDEALAKGELPRAPAGDADSESGARLAKGLACLKMLRRMRGAARGSGELTARGTGSATWGVRRKEDRAVESGRPVHAGRLGRFEIRRELGRGGYGVVFLAYDPQLRREVALKVPRAETLIELGLRARFEHEARAAAGLQHPHIVQVFEAGDVGLVCYIASAYCPGVNLADWLRQRHDPVPYRDAARLVAVLADAVDHAHERGVLHRDLKPANVILQHRSWSESALRAGETRKNGNLPDLAECDPVITDFGLALTEHDQSRCTITGTILGTPNYMAPEQAG